MPNWAEKLYKADIILTASGDTTVIAAPGSGKRIAIDGIYFVVGSAVNIQFVDGATAYGGLLRLGANQSIAIENTIENYDGVMTMSGNSAFIMNQSGAVSTGGFVRYRILDNA